uniref:Uncharacterized protein n=1 Tax=Halamphora americana TaxID=2305497 RepID=A0A516ZB54_9STRA|nr:hypothetical protein [Halamphora americana]QDR24930.1 hypothetical protein [Halamphora americana]
MFLFYSEVKLEILIIINKDRVISSPSKTYNNFIKQFKGFIELSISSHLTPKYNLVLARFVITFKEHRSDGIKFQEKLDVKMFYSNKFISFRKLTSQDVKRLNKNFNKKTSP